MAQHCSHNRDALRFPVVGPRRHLWHITFNAELTKIYNNKNTRRLTVCSVIVYEINRSELVCVCVCEILPRAILSTLMILMMVGFMGSAAFIFSSSRVMPMIDNATIAISSWFHLNTHTNFAHHFRHGKKKKSCVTPVQYYKVHVQTSLLVSSELPLLFLTVS